MEGVRDTTNTGQPLMWKLALKLGGALAGVLTGGTLDRLLGTVDKYLDNEVTKEDVKARVTETWVNAQTKLLVGRTWWFQLFFVIPMAFHWACLNWVSAVPQWGWTVHPLPDPFDDFQGWIISALFVVDGGKALLGRLGK